MTDDHRGAERSPWRPVVWSVVAAAVWGSALVLSYNLYKGYVIGATRMSFPPWLKELIKGSIPWSIALLLATGWLLARPLRARRWVCCLLVAVLVQNLVFLPVGWQVVVVIDLALVLTAVGSAGFWGGASMLRAWRAVLRRGAPGGRTAALASVWALTVLAGALLVRQIYLQWNNTVHDNGKWIASKTEQGKALIGAFSYIVTRKALARNRLNLGTWHGYHEVFYRDPVAVDRLSFDARVEDLGYLALLVGADSDGYLGVRLSRHRDFPSTWFRSTPEGEFLDKKKLDLQVSAGWNRIHLDFRSRELRIAGEPVGRCPWPVTGKQRIGFRGGRAPALIDEIEIVDRTGRIISEDFASRENGWDAFGAAVALLALLGVLVAVVKRRSGGDRSPLLFAPIALGIPLTVSIGVFAAADYWFLGSANPVWIDYRGFETGIETRDEIVGRLREELARRGEGPRIVVLGTSQTWGSGAAREADTWVRRLEVCLNEGRPPGERWQAVNGGISGSVSEIVFETYRSEWADPAPRLVLVVLSNNDPDPAELRANLLELAQFNRQRGIDTVFVLEPNSVQSSSFNLLPNHEVMREVGSEAGIAVIDMPARIAEYEDRGFLWWDTVHLTSCGHRFFAAILCEELDRLGLPRQG